MKYETKTIGDVNKCVGQLVEYKVTLAPIIKLYNYPL